jgi:hypothetical protein
MHTGIHNAKMWDQTAREGDMVANSIKESLAKTYFSLLLSLSSIRILRRLIRRAEVRRLEFANRPQSFTGGHDRKYSFRPILAKLKQWPIWFLGTYKFMIGHIWTVRNVYLGTLARPRSYTSRFLIQKIIRPDLVRLVDSRSEALLICDDASRSCIRVILTERIPNLAIASFIESERGDSFVLNSTTKRVPPMSYDLVFLEQDHKENIQKIIESAYEVLRQNGRLVILLTHFGSNNFSFDAYSIQHETMNTALRNKFSIEDYLIQGGIGSVLNLTLEYRLMAILRRWPVLARMIELTFIWIPLYMLTGTILNLMALMVDWIDWKKSVGISSLTLATKVTARQQILPPAGKESAPVGRSSMPGA